MSEKAPVIENGERLAKPCVEALGYIGGEGGYCEPLVIDHEGEQHYVMHEAHLKNDKADRWGSDNWVMVHQKVEYDSREKLETAFKEVLRRLSSAHLDWEETNGSLDFEIPEEHFASATSRIVQVAWDQRPIA
jgi:hypothetical protein